MEGTLPNLQKEIAAARVQGKLDQGQVQELARAVIRREIAPSGEEASARIRLLEGCFPEVRGDLHGRASKPDDTGAAAALLLVERRDVALGAMLDRSLEKSGDSPKDPAWRAVAARSSTLPEHGLLRREFMSDPDTSVRLGALRAAVVAHSKDDLEKVAELSRLDPDAENRKVALFALGAIGGERAVSILEDRWNSLDLEGRTAILDAWEIAWTAGGEASLLKVAETEKGLLRLRAALRLMRHKGQHRGFAEALLVGGLERGTSEEKLAAIGALNPESKEVLSLLVKALDDTDSKVTVAAAKRLIAASSKRKEAESALRRVAKGSGSAVFEALEVLASLGDGSILPALDKGLVAENSASREAAGRALWKLGKPEVAATALADDAPEVRVGLACWMLAHPR